jgi:hypothetical protein
MKHIIIGVIFIFSLASCSVKSEYTGPESNKVIDTIPSHEFNYNQIKELKVGTYYTDLNMAIFRVSNGYIIRTATGIIYIKSEDF